MTQSDSGNRPDGSTVFTHPPDLLEFESTEHRNFLSSLVSYHDEINILYHIHDLYARSMTNRTTDRNRIIIFQLLAFVHYHFLVATSSYMRCHMAEGFNSARAAIDGALIASQIIHDPASQFAYINRTKPFDKLIRHFKNLIKDKKPLPHPVIEQLIRQYDVCSQFASHADIQTFAHRLEFPSQPQEMLSVRYFQFARDEETRKHYFLGLLHIFVLTLDIFSGFFVDEKKCLPQEWRQELHDVSRQLEYSQQQLRPDRA